MTSSPSYIHVSVPATRVQLQQHRWRPCYQFNHHRRRPFQNPPRRPRRPHRAYYYHCTIRGSGGEGSGVEVGGQSVDVEVLPNTIPTLSSSSPSPSSSSYYSYPTPRPPPRTRLTSDGDVIDDAYQSDGDSMIEAIHANTQALNHGHGNGNGYDIDATDVSSTPPSPQPEPSAPVINITTFPVIPTPNAATTTLSPPPPPSTDFSSPASRSHTLSSPSPPKRRQTFRFYVASLRLLLLGSSAIRREARQLHRLSTRNSAHRLAMTRGVVIFADYLCDLCVLDLNADLCVTTLSIALPSLILGLSMGTFIADFVSGICTYVDDLKLFPTAESSAANNEDVFDQLFISCMFVSPPLSIAVSFAAYATGPTAITVQAMAVCTLTLLALAPILSPRPTKRSDGKEKADPPLIKFLRDIRFLKQRKRFKGRTKICGIADPAVDAVVPLLDAGMSRVREWRKERTNA